MNEDKLLKAMQGKQLELLKELERVCNIIGVRYYLASGTCLGAVRHQGFIPWDDDIDIYMYWKDAEKLADNQDLFKEHYFVQNKKTDPNVRTSHYRLRDSNTSLFLEEDKNDDINHGIFIDIYILYPYPDNKLLAYKIIFDSFIYRILIAEREPQNHGKGAKIIGKMINTIYRGERREKKLLSVEKEYRFNKGRKYLATYFGRDTTLFHSIVYPKIWFIKPKKLKFEGLEVNCPGDTDAYCRLQYGDTYMQLPPKEKRRPHHDFIYCDVNEAYTKFKGKYY